MFYVGDEYSNLSWFFVKIMKMHLLLVLSVCQIHVWILL